MGPKCLPVEKTQYFFKVFGLTIKSSTVVKKIFASALVATFECKDKCKVDNAHITVPSV